MLLFPNQPTPTKKGFTLVETLLSVVLVGLLVTAMVVNFVGMEQTSKLNEGATQVEALFRFARAHAANTGRIVQIRAIDGSLNTNIMARPSLEVVCEADPLKEPGTFKPIPQSQMYVQQIQEQVCLEELKIVQAEQAAVFEEGDAIESAEPSIVADAKEPMPAISFFPDGSSDSAELILLSLAEEEPRKVQLKLSGILGTVDRNPIYSSNAVANGTSSKLNEHSYETVLR